MSRGIRGWVRSPLKWDKTEKFWDGKCWPERRSLRIHFWTGCYWIFSPVTVAEERKEGRGLMVMFADEPQLGASYSLEEDQGIIEKEHDNFWTGGSSEIVQTVMEMKMSIQHGNDWEVKWGCGTGWSQLNIMQVLKRKHCRIIRKKTFQQTERRVSEDLDACVSPLV